MCMKAVRALTTLTKKDKTPLSLGLVPREHRAVVLSRNVNQHHLGAG